MAYFLAHTDVADVKFATPSKKRNEASSREEFANAKTTWIESGGTLDIKILKANGFAEPVDAGGVVAGGAVAGSAVAGGAVAGGAVAGAAVAGVAVAINLDLSDDEDEVVGDVATNLADTLRLAADVEADVKVEGDKKA